MVTFFGTRTDSTLILVLARILPFFGIHTYGNLFKDSPSLAQSVFRYSHGYYLIPVFARILPLLRIHTPRILFWDSSGQFIRTRTNSN